MSKVSLWKRVGGWLNRDSKSTEGIDVVSVDAETLPVGPNDPTDIPEDTNALSHRDQMMDEKLAAIETGFNRLVDVMAQVNETMTLQRQQNEQIQRNMDEFPELMRKFPIAVDAQSELVDKLADEMKEQFSNNQEIIESMKEIPESSQKQLDSLDTISSQLKQAGDTDSQMLDNIKAQSISMANIGELLEKNDEKFQSLMTKQQSHLTKLFYSSIVIAVIAIGVAAGVLYITSSSGSPPPLP